MPDHQQLQGLLRTLCPNRYQQESPNLTKTQKLINDIKTHLHYCLNSKSLLKQKTNASVMPTVFFGMIDFMQVDFSHTNGRNALCQQIKNIIELCEPRLKSIDVDVISSAQSQHLCIRIEAQLNSTPYEVVSFESIVHPQSQQFIFLRG